MAWLHRFADEPSPLHKFQPKLTAHGHGCFAQRAQRHRVVVGIEQAVEGGAAGVHPPRHFRLGKVFLLHGGFNLPSEDALDCARGDFLVDALLAEPAIEGIRYVFFSCACSFYSFKCQSDVAVRGLLSLLDEAVKQHHTSPVHAEKNTRNTSTRQAAPDFAQFAAKRTNEWHADGP
jgi:hypothetical protein